MSFECPVLKELRLTEDYDPEFEQKPHLTGGDYDIDAIRDCGESCALAARVVELEAELERERMRLAACGVAARSNTDDTVRHRLAPNNTYYSASYADVCNAVDREMVMRFINKEELMTGNEDSTVQFGEDPPWDDLPPVDREKANKELETNRHMDETLPGVDWSITTSSTGQAGQLDALRVERDRLREACSAKEEKPCPSR